MLCCCCVAEFRLIQFDSCDQQAFYEGLFHTATLKSLHLPELLECKHVVLSS